VRFDRNRYSVDAKAAVRPVSIHAYADRVVIRMDGEVVAEHARVFGRDRTVYEPWHYVPVLAGSPERCATARPFGLGAVPMLAAVRHKLGKSNDADRQFVEILMAAREFSLEAVEAACAGALAAGTCTSAVIVNLLARQTSRWWPNRSPLRRPWCWPSRQWLTAPATTLCCRGPAMARHDLLAMMLELHLAGMRAAYDEVMADGIVGSIRPNVSSAIC